MSTAEVTALQPRQGTAVGHATEEWSVEQMVIQAQKIQECMSKLMKRDEHYGVIPGTQGRDGKPPKPTLLKPGAEKLCLMFRLDPEYDIVTAVREPTLISYTIRCTLFHIPTGARVASGLGSCNSREEKYLRAAPKKCPACEKETIFRSKLREGVKGEPGWFCWSKKGGCGKNYEAGDASIEQQDAGIKDPADLDNTLLKMGCKRSLIAAVLNGTAASDCFTQDLEDLTEKAAEYIPPPPKANTVKHDGAKASHEQVALLHMLRTKAGIPACDGKCATTKQKFSKSQGKLVDTAIRCAYHTQLAAFKTADGFPVLTSVDLSPDQISNLISRYENKIKSQEAAVQSLDIGGEDDPDDDVLTEEERERFKMQMEGEDRPKGARPVTAPGSFQAQPTDSAAQSAASPAPAASDTGEAATEEQKLALKRECKRLELKAGYIKSWISTHFGLVVHDVKLCFDGFTENQAFSALLLLQAHGKANYSTLLADMKARGKVS